jgi:hypothetical protein
MQAALGRLHAAIGVDPPPERFDVLDIAGIVQAVRRAEAEQASRPAPPASAEPPARESQAEPTAAAPASVLAAADSTAGH